MTAGCQIKKPDMIPCGQLAFTPDKHDTHDQPCTARGNALSCWHSSEGQYQVDGDGAARVGLN